MRTFEEILKEVTNACSRHFLQGIRDIRPDVLDAATKIYIAEMQKEYTLNLLPHFD